MAAMLAPTAPVIRTLAGHRALVWREQGARAPLVLLHGFMGRPESFEPLAALGREGPIVALALPGHAPGMPAEPAAGFDGAVGGIASALRALGRLPVHLLGYSMGARLALGVLVQHPGLVARATLVGAGPGLANPAERAARRAEEGQWAARLRSGPLTEFVDFWEQLPLFASQASLPEALQLGQRAARLAHDPEQLARSLEQMGLAQMPDLMPALPSIDVPVDLVAGGLDVKFCAHARRMAAALRRATVHVAPGVRHNVVLEAPGFLAPLLA